MRRYGPLAEIAALRHPGGSSTPSSGSNIVLQVQADQKTALEEVQKASSFEGRCTNKTAD